MRGRGRTLPFSISALVALGLLGAAQAAENTMVARPGFSLHGRSFSTDVAFFIRVDNSVGVAAVSTAHTHRLEHLVQTKSVEFRRGRSGEVVARSKGFLVPPGLPFASPRATLRDDFLIYTLEAKPVDVEVLSIETRRDLPARSRVRIVGIPLNGRRDQEEVRGRVAEQTRDHMVVDLDVPYDLRGWGGAPVLSVDSGKVVGILQASSPKDSPARVWVSPIAGVRNALRKPISGGAGRPFSVFVTEVNARDPVNPTPRSESRADGGESRAATRRAAGQLLKKQPDVSTRVHLDVEYPADGAVVGDAACGAFVSGRALALHGDLIRFDVVIVIDTSLSTIAASGADINGNGVIGEQRLGRLDSIFSAGSEDRGDSILAAEVAAAFQLLRGLDPRSTRVGVVTFSGEPPGANGIFSRPAPPPALTLEPLTTDYSRVEDALNAILATDPKGSTHMAAGVDQATIELLGLSGSQSTADPNSEKLVFFFTDGRPTLPYARFEAENVRAVLRAANRARRSGVRIHSFAIGPEALDHPMAVVEMALRTDGYFTPVRHPGDLVDVVEEVNFANLREISMRSATTGERASPFRASADGTWGGFVKLRPGVNEIEVVARAEDGTRAVKRLKVRYDPEAVTGEVPRALVVQRNRLLEDCLRELKRARLATEEEHAEDVRKELLVEIEKERARARERAASQRKRLDLEVDENDTEPN